MSFCIIEGHKIDNKYNSNSQNDMENTGNIISVQCNFNLRYKKDNKYNSTLKNCIKKTIPTIQLLRET